ncbi:hypothetical protein M422DRAFT_784036 [Sphaerobolus stellatus SS14]|uniref:Thioester reductase (TE) domain-containing protein n=1 Tax=Sphaerobolus stellatus (strain SS14) TaxID=990650 RepID=A0A0C9UN95_SPHS4|nr:hypothetical protein M422DRAFT_784036 [Sphaerobolus stellatus SS14]
MSHGTGVHLIPWIATSGLIVAAFPPSSPAKYPSPEATFQGYANSKAEWVLTFPNMIESWSSDPHKVELLREAKGVIYMGSFLNKPTGDFLVQKGVKVFPFFGMAEAGTLGEFICPHQGEYWEYFPLTAHSGGKFIDAGDDLYELVIVEQQHRRLPVANMELDGARAYASKDLFVPHPHNPGYWRICGRRDDRIIHPNGEKTTPVLMEHIVGKDPRVKSAIVFGNGRYQTGVLIQLEDEYIFDPIDKEKLEAFREYIKPQLAEANSVAPTYAQLYPEMVMVTIPSKPFQYTEKGSMRRAAILRLYEQEIDDFYMRAEQRILSNVELPADWSFNGILNFVRNTLSSQGLGVQDSEDVFHHGCNSLQAIRIGTIIRNALQRKGYKSKADSIPRHLVYEESTPTKLAEFIFKLISSGDAESAEDAESTRLQVGASKLEKALERYCEPYPHRKPADLLRARDQEGCVFLITGTTGTVGGNLLVEVIQDPHVTHVYAFLREKKGESIEKRQQFALKSLGFDPGLAAHPKVTLLVGNLERPQLGLCNDMFTKLCQSVTHIFHIGWNVNWSAPLSAFEDQLRGVRNVVELSLASDFIQPPALFFTSSLGVYENLPPGSRATETSLESLEWPVGHGYAEAKAISERILEHAAKSTELCPTVLRLAQISGGSDGHWDTSEWFPAILKSSIRMGALPRISGGAAFVPSNVAARVLKEARDSGLPFLHVAHPKPARFMDFFDYYSKALHLPIIPFDSWVERLEALESSATADDLSRVPALSLLDFFRGRIQQTMNTDSTKLDAEAFGFPLLNTDISITFSYSLANAAPLGSADAEKWLAYWRNINFI